MTAVRHGWTRRDRSSANGANASAKSAWPVWKKNLASGAQRSFPPRVVVAVKALACELPHIAGVPLSRWSIDEIKREVIPRGIVASIGETTLWRWLSEDATRPWTHRSWIFPRDPAFEEQAGRVLDLYQGHCQGNPLTDADFVISTDEKTSIQARRRRHPTLAPAPDRSMRVEHEYVRRGAGAYLAAWDVRRAKIDGRCERQTGSAPFGRLVHQVMRQEPYCSARRVFWIMDNGSSHRGQACVKRRQQRWPTLIPVHTPVHASWLNPIEIYFSIVQRKVLTPNDLRSLAQLKERLLNFQAHDETVARPFQWQFTRHDLAKLLCKVHTDATTARAA